MATETQVDEIIRLAERVHSSDAFRCMDEANAGIGGTLRMLAEARKAETVVTAGDIAERLGVTTARVAALLKRLESKGLIARRRSEADARVTEVVLTDKGAACVHAFYGEMRAQVAMLINELGEERLRAFFLTACEMVAPAPAHDAAVGCPRCTFGFPMRPCVRRTSCRLEPTCAHGGAGSARVYIS